MSKGINCRKLLFAAPAQCSLLRKGLDNDQDMNAAVESFWTVYCAGAAHLQLFIGHVLAQLLGHALEVLEGDLAGLIVVK